jgi:hypothetical protein
MKPIRRDGWSISAIVLQFDAQHMNGRDRPYGPLTARGGESDARASPRQPQGAQNLCVIRFMAIASFLLWTIGGLDMGCASDTEGRTPPGGSAIIVDAKKDVTRPFGRSCEIRLRLVVRSVQAGRSGRSPLEIDGSAEYLPEVSFREA